MRQKMNGNSPFFGFRFGFSPEFWSESLGIRRGFPVLKVQDKMPKILASFASLLMAVFLPVALAAQLSRPDDPNENMVQDSVQMYLDFTSLGRSPYRQLRLAVELRSFARYRSYPVAEPAGWSTAVLLSGETQRKLLLGELPLSQYIRTRGGVHYLDYAGIRIGFGLEAPPKAVFDMIAKTYETLPTAAEQVAQRYRNGYTIRIYQAENVLDPENQMISYPEAVLAATLIGDSEQLLWGVHDGRDLLNRPYENAVPNGGENAVQNTMQNAGESTIESATAP